jgi:hypothetical protein
MPFRAGVGHHAAKLPRRLSIVSVFSPVSCVRPGVAFETIGLRWFCCRTSDCLRDSRCPPIIHAAHPPARGRLRANWRRASRFEMSELGRVVCHEHRHESW